MISSTTSCLLGVDISTTATKAVLIDETGRVLAMESSPYPLSTPRPLWAEQDPELWWTATCASVRGVLRRTGVDPAAIRAVGLTGQMHGLVLLDERGAVARPAILWNDQRASVECGEMRRRLGLERLVEITGNDAFPGFTAPKLLWVRRHEPEVYRRVGQVLLPKDFVRWRLTGDYATDRAGAGGTLLLDLRRRDWSRELLEAFDLPTDWFPATHEGVEVTGLVDAAGAAASGLPQGTPVVGGGGDQAAQAVGVGAVEPGVAALTLGTSGVVFATTDRPVVERRGRLHAFPHAVPGKWHVMGVMLSAAGSLRWYRDTVAPEVGFDELVAEAEGVEAGCEGLTFLPYLSGERTPHADPRARGAFVGLTLKHGRPHMTRSVLEGVAFGLRDNLRLMAESGLGGFREIRLSGGGAESPLWRRILADVLELELIATEPREGAAFGAALLAGVGAGVWRDADEACHEAVRPGAPTRPAEGAAKRYREPYERFRRSYPALTPLWADTDSESGEEP